MWRTDELSNMRPRLWRALLSLCAAWHLLGGVPAAVSQDSAKQAAANAVPGAPTDSATKPAAAADSAKPRTPDELDAIVAPVALFPDELLAQTLVASTYPLEIVQLHQWLAKHPDLKDKALADSVAKQLDYCTYCPKMCRHSCPVSTASGKETYIPQVKMDRMNQLRLGRGSWTTESTDPLWACTGCRHCTMYCDHGNEPGLVLFTGHAAAVEHGQPHPALTNYSERFRAREQRLSAQLQAGFKEHLATEGDIGYWPGCDAVDKGAADIAAAMAVFERTGLENVKIVEAPQV
jgi:ferredoxin